MICAVLLLVCKDEKKKTAHGDSQANTPSAFDAADQIIKDIKVLEFPDNRFVVTDFGAVANGETDNTEAIKKAIAACNKAGAER